jgi:uncharacterized OsmC-like protein
MALTEISLTQEHGVVCQIFTKAHIVTADDPAPGAEEDEGPTPLEYLAAAVGASAAVALRRAAERLDLPLEEVQVNVKYRATHAGLLAEDAGEAPPTVQREIRIRLGRDISEVERDALLHAVKASPVDRVMRAAPRIEDALYVFGYADPDGGRPVDAE